MSAFYYYNFHIFRLFGFGKEEVDVYRFMSKQFIALFAGLLVLCSIQFISPPKMGGLILRRKTGTVSVKVFTFHVHLGFERHTGTEGREPLLSCSVYFVTALSLTSNVILFMLSISDLKLPHLSLQVSPLVLHNHPSKILM